MALDAKTRLYAVIGDPVKHSLSPLIYNTLFEQEGLNCAYVAFTVRKGEAAAFLSAAKLLGLGGFNVTMPLKEECFGLLENVSDEAKTAGSVNTVSLSGEAPFGHNTDGGGFVRSLEGKLNLAGLGAVIIGAGGAAKSLGLALSAKGAKITFCVRNPQKASGLARSLSAKAAPLENIREDAAGAGLLVNASPLGMTGFDHFPGFSFLDALPRGAVVYDIVYNPLKTELLRTAETRGFVCLNGLDQLANQAALAFETYTGIRPSLDRVLAKLTDIFSSV